MTAGGPRPNAGRQKGSKNKATIQKELQAAAQVAAASGGKPRESALAVIERLMGVAEGAAAANRPTLQKDVQAGAVANPDGDWTRFREFLRLAMTAAMELAKYQAPQIKAVDAPAPPPEVKSVNRQKRFTLTIFEGDQRVGQAEVEPKAAA